MDEKSKPDLSIEIEVTHKSIEQEAANHTFTREKLQDAIIWSEILGKPVSKRRKRRHNGL